MRVALTDDTVLFREGLAALLRELGIEVTHQASNERELLDGIVNDPPDVVIMDIRLSAHGAEGLHAAESIRRRHPRVGILLLSAYAETAYAVRLLEGGASGVGYLVKDRVGRIEVLEDALRRVAEGQTAIDPEIVQRLMDRPSRQRPLDLLSGQERKVLQHMAEGRSNNGVAEAMFLAPKTVEKHILSIFKKLGLEQQEQDNRRVLAVLHWLQG
ncbi:response regulator transcription factor [Paractinoplanes ferrugineus]|uniref:DNA-binding response regulator n=1 Tax=Paractinoplanes ferrugineus TaxID=113564 RepID=A0A919MFA8_9ACTN|nr:response regulator transcription factor [Actinoplanes ferrugineus]GIE13608.1 DNA-binding response regulator [Actinoplanes ferrugineus]